MKINKVIIFTDEAFPHGMAATNRIISYIKGFTHHNVKARVICLRSTEIKDNVKNNDINGVYDDMNYRYLSNSTIKPEGFVQKRVRNTYSNILLFFYSLRNIDNLTISIYYSSHTIPAMILWLTNKIKGGKLLKEESEHPEVYVKGKGLISKILFKKIQYQLFDVHLLMTKNLISYFKDISKIPVLHVPMTVDLKRFDPNLRKHHSKINKILYTGQLDDNKDGVDILLNAFATIVEKHSSYHLYLYGPAKSEESMQKYYDLVEGLGISKHVHFEGLVTREVITEKVLNARLLVLPRPDSLQAQNGFPTKLGEYLASGNPTLVTSVGEIPDYLIDRENTFMAIPGDVRSLEKKLLEIVENYDLAKEVGINGRKAAETYFNNINQTKNILNFFN